MNVQADLIVNGIILRFFTKVKFLRIAFIGDIVGRPGREMIKEHLKKLREKYFIDFVIANYENASHGFGVTKKNADELLSYGIDCLTGGNHTWDKKEIIEYFDTKPVLRPHNMPSQAEGSGLKIFEISGEKLAVLNIMGHFAMPMCDNPFTVAQETVAKLHEDGIKNIFIDFHSEATAEKRSMFMLLKGKVCGIVGTHTHIGTDDLDIEDGTMYLTDIGLTGCYDSIIGMDAQNVLKHQLTGVKQHYDIPKKCKKIMQMVLFDIEKEKTKQAFKIKIFDNADETITQKI